jgi:dTDP-glucose 4,6-dehydratase
MTPQESRSFSCLLVTGGLGFIGSAFIRGLFGELGYRGRVVNLDLLTYAGNPENVEGSHDSSRYQFVHGDIADHDLVLSLVREHGVDGIVNFAAESHVDRSIVEPGAFIRTNVLGTFQLLEVVRKAPAVHFHHVSTDEVYGSLGPTGAFREDTPYQPNSPYSASKAASDHLVRAYAHTYGLSVTLSNSSNNYGPFQFPEKLIPLMILNLLEDKPLPVYGDGKNVRDWLHVDDHVAALWSILTRGRRGETYNVGGHGERTNLEVIALLMRAVSEQTGRPLAELERLLTFVKDRPGHDRRYAIDPAKIEGELGFKSRGTVDSLMMDTVRWYREHDGWIDRVRTGAYREWLSKNYDGR